ncbi:FAD/NAD(P)-binding domain-containing protein [Corynebacterium sp. sy039]|uniref:FAD/NAD(P)-binding protein n=1 Tax=Corynebacterium sp. sy039 TaxID=2599641 RepID=UPI0011B51908|nr:FAD/NAD(P)-binding protein [Corynebacterium sp. sy039]QDZ41958.1 FAD/NAD(P)-binding protein [Corynebacterium sp. sy039]
MSATIAIVGLGPRGISVIERIGAQHTTTPLHLALIDDSPPGHGGRIWDTDQSSILCMNTLAAAVTLFTEPGASVQAPVRVGPTMYEWLQVLRGETLTPEVDPDEHKARLIAQHPITWDISAYEHEIAHTRPESNPSRALYGHYLRWVYQVVCAWLPEHISVSEHHSRCIKISAGQGAGQGYDELTLADGTRIHAHSTVLAPGWHTPALNETEQQLAQSAGLWIAPGSPIEQHIERIPDNAHVLVRGLGMGFFDLMALLSIGRGGRFIPDDNARSGLRYQASGREPQLVVASGRGYPYLPKSDYGGLPPKAALTRLKAVIARHKDTTRQIDFEHEVLPEIIADAHEAYYQVLAKENPAAFSGTLAQVIEAIDAEDDTALHGLIPNPAHRFDLDRWHHPLAQIPVQSPQELTEHIAHAMTNDIAHAQLGAASALKAGLWSISASRKPASILGAQGRYTWASRSGAYRSFMALGQMLGSGPPLFRSQQLLALIDAGLVTFLGEKPQVSVVADGFEMTSPSTHTPVRAAVLVDAWMHSPDVRRQAEPMMLSLGQRVRPWQEKNEGHTIATGSPEVDEQTRLLIGESGERDPRVHLIGIPTYAQYPDTTISPMPGTDPLLLQETDKAARSAVACAQAVL